MSNLLIRVSRARAVPILSKITNYDLCYNVRCTSKYSTEETGNNINTENEGKLGGFAKAFQKYASINLPEAPQENQNFASLLRNSKFIDMGDPEGKIVTGEIFQVVEDDLYIDFGWKFYCVCSRPVKNPQDYVRGAKVRLLVNDLELSSRFLGADTDLTLLEADCRILNVIYSPARRAPFAA